MKLEQNKANKVEEIKNADKEEVKTFISNDKELKPRIVEETKCSNDNESNNSSLGPIEVKSDVETEQIEKVDNKCQNEIPESPCIKYRIE